MPGTARNDNSVSNKELGNGCGIENSMYKAVTDTTDTAGANNSVPDIELSV